MIETIYLEIIILMLLAWIFETKAFPQIILIFLSISMLINEVQLSTGLKEMIPKLLLFSAIILYSALQVYAGKEETS